MAVLIRLVPLAGPKGSAPKVAVSVSKELTVLVPPPVVTVPVLRPVLGAEHRVLLDPAGPVAPAAPAAVLLGPVAPAAVLLGPVVPADPVGVPPVLVGVLRPVAAYRYCPLPAMRLLPPRNSVAARRIKRARVLTTVKALVTRPAASAVVARSSNRNAAISTAKVAKASS